MEYVFENTVGDEKRLALYSGLLSLTFPETKKYTPEFLNWQYNKNPIGKVVGYDAFYDGELVGHYVTLPVLYSFRGTILKGLLSLNTATHPTHQGKGLFTKLAERTYEYGVQQNYNFVIGVANQNSTPGFLRKLGFSLIAPLDARIFIGKSKLEERNKTIIQSSWDESTTRWRLNNPSTTYYNTPSGVVSKTHISFINAVMSQKILPGKIALQDHSNSFFKMSIGLNLNKSGLIKINLPASMKPSPLNLIFKSLGQLSIPTKDEIYFELLDFDAY